MILSMRGSRQSEGHSFLLEKQNEGNLASARMKGNLASDIVHDLKDYYEDCDGSSCSDDDHSNDYSNFKGSFERDHVIDNN